jgi:hypothetical protein
MDVVVEAPDVVSAYELRLRIGSGAEVEGHATHDESCEVRVSVGSEDGVADVVREVQEWLDEGRLPSVWLSYGNRRIELTA